MRGIHTLDFSSGVIVLVLAKNLGTSFFFDLLDQKFEFLGESPDPDFSFDLLYVVRLSRYLDSQV